MPARYTAVPGSETVDADRELDDAFASDNEDEDDGNETTPLTRNITSHDNSPSDTFSQHLAGRTPSVPGAYDFERDYEYDVPPPGSPPRPSAVALPNDYGNSNGQIPTSPIRETAPRRSFFRHLVGSVLPTHYQRIETQGPTTRVGGGTDNDGVFANVMAKPQVGRVVHDENGNQFVVPEESQKEMPPSYQDAQADAVPTYFETTVHAPAGFQPGDDMIVEDLPTGQVWVFVLNIAVSFFFQLVGFLLTYLMHTSHAAKFGSRAGLGMTLIQLGFYSRTLGPEGENGEVGWQSVPVDSGKDIPVPADDSLTTESPIISDGVMKDWLSFMLMTMGWFLLLTSVAGFWRVKRWELSIRRSTPAPLPASTQIEQERNVRRNLSRILGVRTSDEDHYTAGAGQIRQHETGGIIVIPDREALEEARLARDLRAAGLL